ncbi:hypothetical protein GGU11DRAFT_524293 [Lentinula aff. detonsa]|nr:hypothetical protein GGU11DRAFT_524293 [Lentinula aff. detonsa]
METCGGLFMILVVTPMWSFNHYRKMCLQRVQNVYVRLMLSMSAENFFRELSRCFHLISHLTSPNALQKFSFEYR